jgi:hypothetical protein
MHKEILSPEQKILLPVLRTFSELGFFLVGGTAIALFLAHRRSIDFDLFICKPYKKETIRNKLLEKGLQAQRTLYEDDDQLDLIVGNVKITYLFYPYEIPASVDFEKIIALPSLLDLASMKAYALGRRAKWKDYVDLYFILKGHTTLNQLTENTDRLFGGMFNEKLFREQLSYFEDIDYSEKIDYLPERYVDDNSIREFLVMQATEKM